MCNRLTKLSVTMWYTFFGIFDDTSLWILPKTHDPSLCDTPDELKHAFLFHSDLGYQVVFTKSSLSITTTADPRWFDNKLWFYMLQFIQSLAFHLADVDLQLSQLLLINDDKWGFNPRFNNNRQESRSSCKRMSLAICQITGVISHTPSLYGKSATISMQMIHLSKIYLSRTPHRCPPPRPRSADIDFGAPWGRL